jgi:enamine deaminase RidA (YjgF/YER057c/UK114 family)
LWGEGLEGNELDSETETASNGAFKSMLNVLQNEGMNFDNIIRQWNYIGEILRVRKTDLSEIQNYQIFNEVRHRFYQKYKRIAGFPAATGIGCKYNFVAIGFNAFSFKSGHFDILIDNPLQVNPFAYDQDKLIGTESKTQYTKHPPEFVRGRLISDGNNSVLYVSGTASIIGQKVTGIGDIETQTRTTIEIIKTLVDAKNISRFCTQPVLVPEKYRYLRVYVKHMQDIPKVKSICQGYFGEVPAIYIEADICRESLLMEIEAELSC